MVWDLGLPCITAALESLQSELWKSETVWETEDGDIVSQSSVEKEVPVPRCVYKQKKKNQQIAINFFEENKDGPKCCL